MISIRAVNELTEMISLSYEHPFVVSNAVRDIQTNILAMHRSMKDLVLAEGEQERAAAVSAVDSCESVVGGLFTRVALRYLGPEQDVQDALETFLAWKPIRREVIALTEEGHRQAAATITTGKGNSHVQLLNSRINVIRDFAQNKRRQFLDDSRKTESRIRGAMITGSIIIVIITILIGIATIIHLSGRVKHIAHISNALYESQKLESVGRLSGSIAHDFNNMLMPIISYSDLLLTTPDRPQAEREQLEQIHYAGHRAADLTRQLLAFSRKQVLELKVLNINDVVAGMVSLLRRLIGENINLQTALAPDLGNINADRAQLDQILLNIVVNARDAMPEGGKLMIETTNVTLDKDYAKKYLEIQPGEYVLLAISDTGEGISSEVAERIFEPFFTTKGKDTGLGLATIYGIVKQHGGNINVYSEPNQGTSFKVYLPRIFEQKEKKEQQAAAPSISGNGKMVLVVEDDTVVRNLVRKILLEKGFRVECAADGEQALKLANQLGDGPDLLLTDVVMPNMSGKQLYTALLELWPDLPVLYMSGYTNNVITHHGILDKHTIFLQKPFSVNNLLQKMIDTLSMQPEKQ